LFGLFGDLVRGEQPVFLRVAGGSVRVARLFVSREQREQTPGFPGFFLFAPKPMFF